MTQALGNLLQQRRSEQFVGRKAEMARLLECLTPGGPIVAHVHGIAGIGKTTILARLADLAEAGGSRVLYVDARTIEPTDRGLLAGLRAVAELPDVSLAETAKALGQSPETLVIVLDNYELLYVLDAWVRQQFVPALPANVRLMIGSRVPPLPGWTLAPEWQGLFASIPLPTLDDDEARELLALAGITGVRAQRVGRLAAGHPLALRMAAVSVGEQEPLEAAAYHGLLQGLAETYLAQVEDDALRDALQAGAVVRRITVPLLEAMLPDRDPQALYRAISELPFVDTTRDGLMLHGAVQDAIAASLRASDPERYRGHRQTAWRALRMQRRGAGVNEAWRYTGDMLFLFDNPFVREAFFPTGSDALTVEPATPDDWPAMRSLAANYESPSALALIEIWWQKAPQVFKVTRTASERVAGFYIVIESGAINHSLAEHDPVAVAWLAHLRDHPILRNETVVFARRWLSWGHGEAPSPTQSSCFVHTKQRYLTLRPQLRRCYISVINTAPYAPIAEQLGFEPITEIEIDGVAHALTFVDFGPDSIDGWVTGHVAKELGLDAGGVLDAASHELVVDGRRQHLTPLEFEFVRYLVSHEGTAVSRANLMEAVWGYDFAGESNVVDTLVAGLRRKLRGDAALIETVWGVGYRFKQD
jgi:hypothetical protein